MKKNANKKLISTNKERNIINISKVKHKLEILTNLALGQTATQNPVKMDKDDMTKVKIFFENNEIDIDAFVKQFARQQDNENDGFSTIRRKTPRNTKTPPEAASVVSPNIFDTLMEEATNTEKCQVDLRDPVRPTNKATKTQKTQPLVKDVPLKQRQPPIITDKFNTATLVAAMKEEGACFKISRGRFKDTIICQDEESHERVFEYIRSKTGAEAHTYTRRSEKESIVLLKGVHFTTEPSIIEKDIFASTGIKATVVRFETEYGKKNNIRHDIFRVKVANDKDLITMKKLTNIYHHTVTWEKELKRGLTQCYNCQSFGHISKNCGKHHKCVKCMESHEPGKCLVKIIPGESAENRTTKAMCVNCGGDHPASFRGCPEAIKLLNRIKKEQEAKQQERQQKWERMAFIRNSAARGVVPEISFSDIIRGNSISKQSNTLDNTVKNIETANKVSPNLRVDDTMGFINSECEDLFHLNFNQLIGKVISFVNGYKKLDSKDAKKTAMLNFSIQICMN